MSRNSSPKYVDSYARRGIARLVDASQTTSLAMRPNTEILLMKVEKISPEIAEQMEKLLEGNRKLQFLTEAFFSQIAQYSPETHRHVMRTTELTAVAAHKLIHNPLPGHPMSAEDAAELCIATALHDFGKLYVPRDILHDSHQLHGTHAQIMRNHVVYSAQAAQAFNLPERTVRIVATHHENLDGTGYPHGLTERQLDPITRILPITDRLESLTGIRSFRPVPLSAQNAIDTLQDEMESGMLDPELMGHCIPSLKVFIDHHPVRGISSAGEADKSARKH